MTSLPFPDASFDAVVEKGALDCLLTVVRDPWNVPADIAATVRRVLEESHRVLRPDGCFISITFSAPHFRRPLLNAGAFTWRVAHDTFGGDSWHYYFYTCRKGLKAPNKVEEEETVEKVRSALLTTACVRLLPHCAASTQPIIEPLMHDFMDEPDFLMRVEPDE